MITMQWKAKYHDQYLLIGSAFCDALNHPIREAHFLSFSDICLVKDDSSKFLLKAVYLIYFSQTNALAPFIEKGIYTDIQLDLHNKRNLNKKVVPAVYPNSSPLSVQGAQGIFWSWNTGSIFTKYDGKVDLAGQDGNDLLDPFAFHIGDDSYYDILSFPLSSFNLSRDAKKSLTITIQIDKMINGESDQIDLAVDYPTHTSGITALADRFQNNSNVTFSISQ